MASNSQKTPFGLSMNRFAQGVADDAIKTTGRSLPASVVSVRGAIVQVKFEVTGAAIPNVTIPLTGSEYARPPIQVGCKGFVIAADAYLGGMSGLGGGTADLTQPGNLTALAFCPIGNSGWSTVDANAYVIYGPNGVVLKAMSGSANFTLTPSAINMSAGGHTIVINASGVVIDGKIFLTHEHTGVQTGGGVTGPVA